MNTLTNNTRVARARAIEVANLRGAPVWCHFATTLTYWIDYVPNWWSPEEIQKRETAGEIIHPKKPVVRKAS